jgi:hypothetical protein
LLTANRTKKDTKIHHEDRILASGQWKVGSGQRAVKMDRGQ